jgi:hypothetical protein
MRNSSVADMLTFSYLGSVGERSHPEENFIRHNFLRKHFEPMFTETCSHFHALNLRTFTIVVEICSKNTVRILRYMNSVF